VAEKCAFCQSAGPLTREHVWPRRFERYVPFAPDDPLYLHERQADGRPVETQWTTSSFDMQVRVACRLCNEGWMQGLDAEAESVVAGLMQGRALSLGTETQDLLVRWGLKVAYVAQYLHPAHRRFVPAEHRDGLRCGLFPADTLLHVAAYRGRHSGWHRFITFDIFDKGDETRAGGKGYLLTFSLAQLVIRVTGYPGATSNRSTELVPEQSGWVRQLLPRRGLFVDLPPTNVLGDDDFTRFSDELPD
jgi:hypothetical protein